MALSKYDASVFIYHAAVVLSGGWVLDNFDLRGTTAMYATALVLGLVWTLYFRFSFIGRLPVAYGGRTGEQGESD